MTTLQQLHTQAHEKCTRALGELPPVGGWPERVKAFVAAASNPGRLEDYKHFPSECRNAVASVERDHGSVARQNFLQAALYQAMADSLTSGAIQRLPERAMSHQLKQLARMGDSSPALAEWLSLDADLYHKEFGLASLRLVAAAAQLIDPRCGAPRSAVVNAGLSGLATGLGTWLACGGFKPMFQIHTHTAYLDEFNEEGWRETYRVCAELYASYPDAKGMFGGSWFYDPALNDISPRLAYLRDEPASGGARFLLLATQGHFVEDALATSPTRRKLHAEGRYQPRSFLMLWPRAAQCAWAERHRS